MFHPVHGPWLRYEMMRSGETGTIQGALQMLSSLKARNVMRQSKERRGDVFSRHTKCHFL